MKITFKEIWDNFELMFRWEDDGEISQWEPFEHYDTESLDELITDISNQAAVLLKEKGIEVIHEKT